MRSLLQKVYSANGTCRFSPMKDLFSSDLPSYERHFANLLAACAQNPGLKVIYGHVFFGIHELVPSVQSYVTILRHPIDRVLSNYFYRAQHGHCTCPNVTLGDYLAGNSPNDAMRFEADNLQTRFLSGIAGRPQNARFGSCSDAMLESAKINLQNHFVFGLTERYDETVHMFRKRLDWQFLPIFGRERITEAYPGKNETSADLLNIAYKNNALDLELYAFAQQLFVSRM
jgi:hypothetical protein